MILNTESLTTTCGAPVRLTSKGQLTIPIAIREQLGLHPGTEVEFAVDGEAVRIRPARADSRGAAIVQHLKRHRGSIDLSTEEILAWTRGWDDQ